MTTEAHTLSISGLRVAVVRKRIKNLHLGVYPPDGRVRVAAPLAVSDAAVRVAVIGKLRWIKRQRATFERQARESQREMVSGESHYYRGRRYRLRVVETDGQPRVELRGQRTLVLHSRPGWSAADRERLLHRWYRERLRDVASRLIARWQSRLGVEVRDWGIKRMKTKWGSCNANAGRIWLNAELIKKAPACLEYVVVHELVHLAASRHDERFLGLMDLHLPTWSRRRTELNAAPLAREVWGC
ncbi:MAG TPA: SprT family zinc-dependent metalloprotease [Polyangiales bacterium]